VVWWKYLVVWNRIDAVIDFSPSLVAAAAGVGPSFLTTTSATGFGY
jgi:hypothetical protein